jgi:hypothetical protein
LPSVLPVEKAHFGDIAILSDKLDNGLFCESILLFPDCEFSVKQQFGVENPHYNTFGLIFSTNVFMFVMADK